MRDGVGDLVLESVAGQRGVVAFDVELELVGQAVLLQEGVAGSAVVVVLVLGRLARFRFDEERALKADLVLVFDHELHEPAKLVGLALEMGVQQRVVAFATAPEHVVLAAQLVGEFEGRLHLGGGMGEHFRVGIGRRARRVPGMSEQVRRSP